MRNEDAHEDECMRAVALGALAIVIASGALAGCREGEQNRPTSQAKGVYSGAADEKLDEDTRRALQERAASQRN